MGQPDYIHAIQTNDRAVLEAMYRQFRPMLKKLVMDLGGTEEDAKDVFQEAVLVIFFMAQKPGFVLTSQFSTLFYSVARNRWLSQRKKKSYSEVIIPEAAEYIPDETPEPDSDDDEQRILLYKAFAQLGGNCQELLLMFFENKTMAEIASKMGYANEKVAAKQKYVCKERLVELIQSTPEYKVLRIR